MADVAPTNASGARVFTWLRESFDRTLSVYHHKREQGHIRDGLPLEAWIDAATPATHWHIDEGQVRHLAGERDGLLPRGRNFTPIGPGGRDRGASPHRRDPTK